MGVCERYFKDAGYSGEVPEALNALCRKFEALREELGGITFEMVSENLGVETPMPEKRGYFVIGKRVVGEVIDLCELGALIFVDPGSSERYDSAEKLKEVAEGFLEEVEEMVKPLYIVNECPVIARVVQKAVGELKGVI